MNKTKRRIFKTAIKLFAEKGFDNAGIEEITAVSGVAKGSLYYHFETKEEIFDTLLDSGFKLLQNSFEIKFRHRESAEEKLKAVVLILIKIVVLYEEFITVVISNSLGENERAIKCQKVVDGVCAQIEEVLNDGINNGEFKPCSTESLSYYIFGCVYSTALYRIKKDKNATSLEIYDDYIDVILGGLKS
ncbi:MAG: TetR/AcrR family transcriptional regulator [Clostridia bacterium]|nr:TetR/AcrR family transcriptional regulator [Clostridia bacterium]